jgi:hypothetical protein
MNSRSNVSRQSEGNIYETSLQNKKTKGIRRKWPFYDP